MKTEAIKSVFLVELRLESLLKTHRTHESGRRHRHWRSGRGCDPHPGAASRVRLRVALPHRLEVELKQTVIGE